MQRVVEKMGAAAVDEEDEELLLVLWRLLGAELDDILQNDCATATTTLKMKFFESSRNASKKS